MYRDMIVVSSLCGASYLYLKNVEYSRIGSNDIVYGVFGGILARLISFSWTVASARRRLFSPSNAMLRFSDLRVRMFYVLIVAPILEEIAFRGSLLSYLPSRTICARIRSVVVTSLLFAMSHYQLRAFSSINVALVGSAFLTGLIYGSLAQMQGVKSSIIAHMVHNLLVVSKISVF